MHDRDARQRSEAELLRLSQDPRPGPARAAAASELLSRYQDAIYLWCRRYVRSHEDALDLAQEVLLAAFRGLPGFQGRSGFAAWLMVIVRNRAVSRARRHEPELEDEAELDALLAPGPLPDERLESRQEAERVLDLMRTHLDPLEREVLWMRAHDGLPVEAITELMGIDERSGARGVLQRARRKLRAALDEGGHV